MCLCGKCGMWFNVCCVCGSEAVNFLEEFACRELKVGKYLPASSARRDDV